MILYRLPSRLFLLSLHSTACMNSPTYFPHRYAKSDRTTLAHLTGWLARCCHAERSEASLRGTLRYTQSDKASVPILCGLI